MATNVRRFLAFAAAAGCLGFALPALAGWNHARVAVELCVDDRRTQDSNGGITASCTVGSKYRTAHEEVGYNYTQGNAGIWHAHHHRHFWGAAFLTDGNSPSAHRAIYRRPGKKGSWQSLEQTWVPVDASHIAVTWLPSNYMQIDTTELSPGVTKISRASIIIITDIGMQGTVEFRGSLSANGKPRFRVYTTGLFHDKAYSLNRKGHIIVLQFTEPLSWTMRGETDTFDIDFEGSVQDLSE